MYRPIGESNEAYPKGPAAAPLYSKPGTHGGQSPRGDRGKKPKGEGGVTATKQDMRTTVIVAGFIQTFKYRA